MEDSQNGLLGAIVRRHVGMGPSLDHEHAQIQLQ